jgi:2-amino-4-hydroxy-6-hydroxymethyldihydropteridine diphosphokinase
LPFLGGDEAVSSPHSLALYDIIIGSENGRFHRFIPNREDEMMRRPNPLPKKMFNFPMTYYLGLGGNLGNSRENIESAIQSLRRAGIRIVRKSSIYRTEPVGFAGQPWFLNQAIAVCTDLSPWELLAEAKAVEVELGRRPGRRNGPRQIDLDILLAEETILRTATLEIPHPRLSERRFVLVPLAEIAPALVHPVFKKSIRAILRECPDRSAVVRIS